MLVFNMVFFAIVRTDSERTLTDCESNRQHSGFAAAGSRRFTIWTCRRAGPGITQWRLYAVCAPWGTAAEHSAAIAYFSLLLEDQTGRLAGAGNRDPLSVGRLEFGQLRNEVLVGRRV